MNNIPAIIYAANVKELENEALYKKAYGNITNERREKVDSLRLSSDRRLSIGAELLLLYGLKELGINYNETMYRYGKNGKPYLAAGADIYFNISHSEDIVICAISSKEIGCDIEKISDFNLKTAKRFFCTEEYEAISSLKNEELMRKMFFRIWTLKESFIKATGMGMSLSMKSFCIYSKSDGILSSQVFNNKTYYFGELSLWQDYKCAVCGLDGSIEERVHFEKLKISDILMTY